MSDSSDSDPLESIITITEMLGVRGCHRSRAPGVLVRHNSENPSVLERHNSENLGAQRRNKSENPDTPGSHSSENSGALGNSGWGCFGVLECRTSEDSGIPRPGTSQRMFGRSSKGRTWCDKKVVGVWGRGPPVASRSFTNSAKVCPSD
ncbi:hypothetical protein [Promicromonospora sp. NPDC050262]|uniref:hypothetical protein n=1 Tax=Promicromonospora sp. NPDC050262 TaxID=3155036 RepID=UPI0033FB3D1C